ncbi:rhomboid family intramembrane serine protease [Phenylobacterium sp.]|uniref:rhomboid family intramembrane serine protease n=1 Tax=Phenylobacterium sp. TaxID=1871053 RepID=UPI00356AEFC4
MTESRFEETPGEPQPQPWSGGSEPQPGERPAREPLFNAPWQAVAVTILIVGGYAIQTLFPVDAIEKAYAFAPANLVPGRWETVITAIFLHGGWAHAMMNGAFALAFSTPLARLFGSKVEGGLLFFTFYILTGVLANLGFAALHPGSPQLVVGASGAVSALMGASARLIGGGGRPGPIFSKPVLSLGGAWLGINLLIAVIGGSFLPGSGSAGVAWEAHLVGFAVGVFLISPFAWLSPRD